MVRARRFRGDQQEDQVHGGAVLRLEVDGPLQPGENPEYALHPRDLAMGNGDAVADPCGAQPLALQHHVENLARGQAADGARPLSQFL